MLTSQQEGFVQSIMNGLNQSDAYRANYSTENMLPQTVHEAASHLAAHHKVSTSISEARAAVASELVVQRKWTAEKLADEAEINLQGAREDRAWAPANRAVELMARLSGNLEGPPAHTEVKITKVTVILPAVATGETVVDVSEYHVVSDVEEENEGP